MDKAEMDEFIGRVREHTDIYSVVSRYVPLTMKNGRYWACCPFHNEKTASFSVAPDKGVFYCFGCHVGGNVFKFLSLIENITYYDAVKLQAERLGIPQPARKQRSPEEIKRANEQRSLLKSCEFACEFYHDNLMKTAEGEIGRKYFESRGITPEIINDFQLGIAPNSWDGLIDEMTRRGFNAEQLMNAGLILRNKSGTNFYDRFRGRVIIPIRDIYGRVVAFGGRILDSEDENNPKYLNSPETAIFKKGQLLFGLDKAHQEISRTNTAIVVEGYMDVISLVSAGVKNVVASLGTAFTENHARLLSRYARKVILCYDSDSAGQRATMRALPIIIDANLEAFVVKVPDGKDPDDFIRKYGKDSFDKLIENPISFVDYMLNYFIGDVEHSTVSGKMRILNEILPLIANVQNLVVENDYCKKLSAELAIDEGDVREELTRVRRQQMRKQKKMPSNIINAGELVRQRMQSDETSAVYKAGGTIIQTVWNANDMLDYVETLIPKDTFVSIHQEIIDYIKRCSAEDRAPNDISAADELSEAANNEMIRILTSEIHISDKDSMKAFNDAINRMRLATLENEYNRLMNDAKMNVFNDADVYNGFIDAANGVKMKIERLKADLRRHSEMTN